MLSKIMDFIDRKIPSTIINTVSLISGIVTIGCWLVSLVLRLVNAFFISEENSNIIINKIIITLLDSRIIGIVSCVFIGLLIYKCVGYYRDADRRLFLYSQKFHDFTHEYRNLDFQLKSDLKINSLRLMDVTERISRFSQVILDSLCDVISDIVRQPVYGCIKLVDTTDGTPISSTEIRKATVSTFQRSSNTPTERLKDKILHKHFVCDNTDYMELMDHNNIRNQFYQPNLLEYDKKLQQDDHEYKNSSSDWSNNYLSTVVVPIQISYKCLNLSEEYAEYKGSYNVMGFLCLDAKKSGVFKRKFKDPICDFAKAYADLLYCLFDLYKYALNKVSDEDYKIKFIEYYKENK